MNPFKAEKILTNPIEDYFDQAGVCLSSSVSAWTSVTPRRLVAEFDLCKLYVYPSEYDVDSADQCSPSAADVVLVVYAMVNTASILDLQKKISTIERLKQQGLTVYLMEWKAPEVTQSTIAMHDYLDQSLHRCVELIREVGQLDKLNLMGVCQGGVISLCYAAMHPNSIRSLIPVVTPVDFHTEEDTLSRLARYLDLDHLIPSGVNIPGVLLAQVFLSLKPMTLTIQKYLDIADNLAASANDVELAGKFMAMEQWIDKTPDQPGLFFKEFVSLLYQKNALCKGELRLGDHIIDLEQIDVPVLNIYALNDHLVPPEASRLLSTLIPSRHYQSLEVPTGHIGIFVSQKSLSHVPKAIAGFIRQV